MLRRSPSQSLDIIIYATVRATQPPKQSTINTECRVVAYTLTAQVRRVILDVHCVYIYTFAPAFAGLNNKPLAYVCDFLFSLRTRKIINQQSSTDVIRPSRETTTGSGLCLVRVDNYAGKLIYHRHCHVKKPNKTCLTHATDSDVHPSVHLCCVLQFAAL